MSTPDYISISVTLRDEVFADEDFSAKLTRELTAAGITADPGMGDDTDFEVYSTWPDQASWAGHDKVYGSDLDGFLARTSLLDAVTRVTCYIENGEDEPYATSSDWVRGVRIIKRDTALVPDALGTVLAQLRDVTPVVDRLDTPDASDDVAAVLVALRAALDLIQEIHP